ncbi:MAG: F0F1 ATP synthase subunit gamma [Jatrophihabitans sp.]
MGAQQRIYRRRIRSIQSTKKITKAMELIAASRIAKLQSRRNAALPYSRELTRALAALSKDTSLKHPMLTGVENPRRVGVLVITSDRGLAGGYNVNAIKRANTLLAEIRKDGKEPVLYVIGRKGVANFRFRRIDIAGSWTGFSEQPQFLDAREATSAVVAAVSATSEGEVDGVPGVDELHVVYTVFKSAITQTPVVSRVAPVELDKAGDEAQDDAQDEGQDDKRDGPSASYEFEPEPDELIAALLPRYISARIFSALLESAASESAARRRAMKSASDNADDLMKTFTRLANQARQAEITQEISEIVGGADALASAGSDQR